VSHPDALSSLRALAEALKVSLRHQCVCGHEAGAHDRTTGYCRAGARGGPRKGPCGCREYAADSCAAICPNPPEGFTCSRGIGHEGPCAALPTTVGDDTGNDEAVMLDGECRCACCLTECKHCCCSGEADKARRMMADQAEWVVKASESGSSRELNERIAELSVLYYSIREVLWPT
jgi:hypothetical protein